MQSIAHVQDYQPQYAHLAISFQQLSETAFQLRETLQPFQPASLISVLDQLYYQLIDHCTAQELLMQSVQFDGRTHRNQHDQLFTLLTSVRHYQLMRSEQDCQELVSQIDAWLATHQRAEQAFKIFQESRRFRS